MRRTFTAHLLLRVAPTVLLMLVATALLAFFSCRREINHVYDMQMANDADVLWSLVQEELHEEDFGHVISHDTANELPSLNGDADTYGNARMFRIWHNDRIVMRSDTALPDAVARQKRGFSEVKSQRVKWRIYTMVTEDGTAIEIGEQQALRTSLMWNILLDLYLPLLLLSPLIGVGLWVAIRQGVQPLQTLVKQIQRRSPDDLAAVSASDLPRDLKPLSKSINRLFTKLSHSLTAERRFADHAAHQLRTPLAGTRLLIQMLQTADSEEERQSIMTDLAESNARASDLVHKLLVAARVTHQSITLQPVALYPIVARAMADLARMAEQKSVTLSLEGDEAAQVMADETLLALMAGNVLDNAVKYAPVGGMVAVRITTAPDMNRLTVIDNGPGIPKAERSLVFEQFYRTQQVEGEGTGLGLAMVADIVHRFNGSIALGQPAAHQGLKIDIDLPVA